MDRTTRAEAVEVRGLTLRYAVLLVLDHTRQTMTIAEIVEGLTSMGVRPGGRQPAHKVVADAMRWELRRGRLYHMGHGRYRGRKLPPTTRRRAQQALVELGAQHPPVPTTGPNRAARPDRAAG
jgi:hypothetical protein